METVEINWQAYAEGHKAWNDHITSSETHLPKNPYPLDSIEWRSWNTGWNQNFNGITKP